MEAERSDCQVHSGICQPQGVRRREGRCAGSRGAGASADDGRADVAYGGIHLRIFGNTPVDKLYQAEQPAGAPSLQAIIDRLATMPLLYQPGTRWVYSVSVDIQGYLVEKLSGKTFPEFLRTRIFEPLGMVDTAFLRSGGEALARGDDLRLRQGEERPRARAGRRASSRARRDFRPAAAAFTARRPTTSASRRCCSTAASSKGKRILKKAPST